MSDYIVCDVCPHACRLRSGDIGACGARGFFPGSEKNDVLYFDINRYEKTDNRKTRRNDHTIPVNYGIATSLALDPIEKKPLNHFFPESRILSFGSFGCNLKCPFCQNHEISMQSVNDYDPEGLKAAYISPEKLASLACKYKDKGNIGVAFTYNEPLISFEYILDTAVLLKDMGMKTVLVTNGCINDDIGDMILPYVDALNIDLKSFKEDTYKNTLKGNLNNVKSFIEKAVKYCHVELTTLVVPGMNSEIEEMEKIAEWIASLKGGAMIPLHISRFFPRYKMSSKTPTDIKLIYELADIARKSLKYVYVGNC